MKRLQNMLNLTDSGYADLKKSIVACTLTSLSLMLPFTVTVLVFRELLRPFTGGELSWPTMWVLFGAALAAAGLVFLCEKHEYRKTYVTAYTESAATRVRVAEHLRRLPMSFFSSKDLSELTATMMSDCTALEQMLSNAIPQLFANGITALIICALMSLSDWRMALSIFCTLPLALTLILATQNIQRRLFERHTGAKLAASNQIQEYLEGMKVIRSCGLGGDKFAALEGALRGMRRLSQRTEIVTQTLFSLASLILRAGVGITVFVGTTLLSGGRLGFIELLMFLLIVARVYGPFVSVLALLPDILYLRTVTRRMRVLMTAPLMEGGQPDIGAFDISLENVSFRYGETALIRDLSVSIPAKGITAIVGPSGSGKSTLLKLIARFWDIQGGSVKIGGVDVREIDPEHLMRYVSFVFQDVVLFDDTVFNNIRIGNMDATEAEVLAAAKAACCDEFIRGLPDGYNTILGENGSSLSGGERQRVSIARALLKNAPIILLDEATASVDPESEVYIQEAIGELIEGKTLIVVAHRLRTITEADTIVVLDKGNIVEQGRHSELLAAGGLYRRMWDIQEKAGGWELSA
ncbi:MAG: ABC transporter ATP-binding protein/permease [Treponema sp.]|jgi:ATP-binding cassette subfamily B protein|nr:ABC transporter ATP-binding protein/permease [Treponema sp.]